MSHRFYRPELDALRFFAFACVFLDHLSIHRAWYQPIHDAGAFGMCMFFLLSAYLIVTILLREKDETGTIRLRAFAARRVLRIWPLYFLVLFIDYVLGHHFRDAYVPNRTVLAFSLLAGNLYVARHGWIQGTVNPLWSLSVEEQFYFVIPALARFSGKRGLAIVCGCTIVCSYAVLVWLAIHHVIPIVGIWANSFVQFQFFAAGGILAMALHNRKLVLPLITRMSLAASGLLLWLIAARRFHMHSYLPVHPAPLVCGYLLVLLGTPAIFLSVIDIELRIPSTLAYLGKISYGLYLFHQLWLWIIFRPIINRRPTVFLADHHMLAMFVALAATIVTAMLSYHYFERPILRFKHRFETVRTRPA